MIGIFRISLAPAKKGVLYCLQVLIVTTLAACAATPADWHSEALGSENLSTASEVGSGTAKSATVAHPNNHVGVPGAAAATPQIFVGRQPQLKSTAIAKGHSTNAAGKGGDIILNFVDTPIRDAVQIILGDHLGKSYTVAADVQGQVNLDKQTGLNADDLIPTLEVLLRGIDARLESDGAAFRIERGARQSFPAGVGELDVLTLRYIDASEFAKLLSDYQVTAQVLEPGNVLALTGASEQIRQVKELARSFDVNWLQGKSIGLFPVSNTSASTIRHELLGMFGSVIDNKMASALRIVAVERSNSIMVISAQADYLQLMGDWVSRLDRIGDGQQKFFIYRVQNGRAGDLAELLRQMFGTPVDNDADAVAQLPGKAEVPDNTREDFRVIADDSSNSLIITGSPHYYKFVRQAMEQLDSTPLQVLVEARIMELTLTDELQYGLEWFLRGSRASSDTTARLDLGTVGISATVPGFSYVIERAGEVRAALNGLAGDSRLKVLSSPSLMVLNNQTASILVGDEVPIPTRQAISNISPDAPTVNEIEYRNTGILLTVSPRVNSGGMVTMDISQEVSSVVTNTTSRIDAPTIQQRQLNSTVSIRSGQTVVLGGLIKEQDSGSESGIPFLKDLPGLGKLFGSINKSVKRTELVVLITPRVIFSAADSTAITEEYRRKLIGLRPISPQQL